MSLALRLPLALRLRVHVPPEGIAISSHNSFIMKHCCVRPPLPRAMRAFVVYLTVLRLLIAPLLAVHSAGLIDPRFGYFNLAGVVAYMFAIFGMFNLVVLKQLLRTFEPWYLVINALMAWTAYFTLASSHVKVGAIWDGGGHYFQHFI